MILKTRSLDDSAFVVLAVCAIGGGLFIALIFWRFALIAIASVFIYGMLTNLLSGWLPPFYTLFTKKR
jgi:hypothetical protein